MNESDLVKLSVAGTLICLLVLYITTSQIISNRMKIGEIGRSYVGKSVNITGEVTGLFTSDGNIFFDLKDDTGKVKVVLWEDTLEVMEMKNVNVSEITNGKFMNILGNVQIYRGEIEVIPVHGNVNLI